MNRKLAPVMILLLSTLLLQACGFQLRGTGTTAAKLPAYISPLHIEGLALNDDMRRVLILLIQNDSVQVTEEKGEAASVLRIRNQRRDSRVLAIDAGGKAVESELFEGLQFDLVDSKGVTLVSQQNLSATRSFINAEVLILGKQEEEKSLRTSMRRDMARQMVVRLSSQLQ